MSKETERGLLFVALLTIFAFIIVLALMRVRRLERELDAYKNAPADTITIIKVDTLLIAEPKVEYRYIKEKEYVTITDSLLIYDTVTKIIELPREYLVYNNSAYRAVVSGVQPRLDTISVYPKTVTNTITKYVTEKKKTRWGLGVQAGYGYNGKDWKPYLGAGVQYNLISW